MSIYTQEKILNERWASAIKVLKMTIHYMQSLWGTGKVIVEMDLDHDNPSIKITVLEPRYHTLDTVPRELDTSMDGEQA